MKHLRFYSNGKFLLSAEYLILKGAQGLALPLNRGQSLSISEDETGNNSGALTWVARTREDIWFTASIRPETNKTITASDKEIALRLEQLLAAAHALNPSVLPHLQNHTITTQLDFDINWGLGSSSTLIANLAQLFEIDPFELFFKTSVGSGYDIACATAGTPIMYSLINQLPEIKPVQFEPHFASHLYFVYLGQKQRSSASIADNITRLEGRESEITRISALSVQMANSQSLEEFEDIVSELENITAIILQKTPIKESTFPDFEGAVKSLGAWGGDFVLMTWKHAQSALKAYLAKKGFHILIPFHEIVLKSPL